MAYVVDILGKKTASPYEKKKTTTTKPKVPAVVADIKQLREEKKTLPKPTVPTVSTPAAGSEIKQLLQEKMTLPKPSVPSVPKVPTVPGAGQEIKQLQQEKLSQVKGLVPWASPSTPSRSTPPPRPAPAPATQAAPQPAPQAAQPPTSQPVAPQAPTPTYGAAQAQGGAPSNLMDTAVRYAAQLQDMFSNSGPDVQAMLAGLQEQYLSQLTSLEQQITRMFQEQMGGIDPATQAALAQLRQTVEEQRRQLWDEMNRRGLLQSGIALEMIDRLQRNQLTAEQQIIANQFRTLQQQMNQALLSFAQQRLDAVKSFGLAQVQAAERQALTAQDIKWKALQMGFSLAEAEEASRRWEQEMGFRQQQFQVQQQQWQQQFEFQRQQAEREAEQWLQQFQFQRQQWQQQYALERQQLSLQQQRLYQPPSVEDQMKQSAYQKLQAGATFDQLTEGEKIAIGWKPWQPTTTFGLPLLPGAAAGQTGQAGADQQVEQAIRTGLASGLTAEQIKQELIRMGIDPRRYSYLLP